MLAGDSGVQPCRSPLSSRERQGGPRESEPMSRRIWVVLLACLAPLLAACGSATPTATPTTSTSATSTAPGPAPPPHRGRGVSGGSRAHGATPSTTSTTVAPQPGWTVLATEASGVAVDQRTVTLADGAQVRIIRFRAGQVHFHLHDGSQDPPAGAASLPADALSAISATEAPTLLAAFNGGFKVTANAGGCEIDGQVLTPLVPGMASFVIDAAGAGSIGIWGQSGFPAPGAQVVSVRQNLPPLVVNGAPSPRAPTWPTWGATVTDVSTVARSALGEDASGNLLYAASASALPVDLAQALVGAGATIGMELDINPDWVQADVAASPGGVLSAAIPGQYPPSTQYQSGWTRDFVTVLAGGPAQQKVSPGCSPPGQRRCRPSRWRRATRRS